jgi:hypothetical protein
MVLYIGFPSRVHENTVLNTIHSNKLKYKSIGILQYILKNRRACKCKTQVIAIDLQHQWPHVLVIIPGFWAHKICTNSPPFL